MVGKPAMSAMNFLKNLFAPADNDGPGGDPNDVRTTWLVEEPSWLSGATSIVNFWPRQHRYAFGLSDKEADRLAIYLDWRMTGQDLRNALVRLASREVEPAKTLCVLENLHRHRTTIRPRYGNICSHADAVSRAACKCEPRMFGIFVANGTGRGKHDEKGAKAYPGGHGAFYPHETSPR